MIRLLHFLCRLLRIKNDRVNRSRDVTRFSITRQIQRAKHWFKGTTIRDSDLHYSRNIHIIGEFPPPQFPAFRVYENPDYSTLGEVNGIVNNLGYGVYESCSEFGDYVHAKHTGLVGECKTSENLECVQDYVVGTEHRHRNSEHGNPQEVKRIIDNLLDRGIYEHNPEYRVFVNGKCATPRMMRRLLKHAVVKSDDVNVPVESDYVIMNVKKTSKNGKMDDKNSHVGGEVTKLAYNRRCRPQDLEIYDDLTYYQQEHQARRLVSQPASSTVDVPLCQVTIENAVSMVD